MTNVTCLWRQGLPRATVAAAARYRRWWRKPEQWRTSWSSWQRSRPGDQTETPVIKYVPVQSGYLNHNTYIVPTNVLVSTRVMVMKVCHLQPRRWRAGRGPRPQPGLWGARWWPGGASQMWWRSQSPHSAPQLFPVSISTWE